MKKTFGYYLLLVATWPMQFFPLGFHHFFSDVLYLIIYKMAGYRKRVVAENLRNAFSEKTESERKKIEKSFYQKFADLFIDTLYFTHTPFKRIKKRLVIENLELLRSLISANRNVILMAGHLGNWEYFQLFREELDARKFFIYKHLQSKTFDQFYKKTRSRAAQPLEMRETFRVLYSVARSGERYAAFFLSDQRPLKREISHWTMFLNQDTPVITGTEKMAQRTNAAVVYTEITAVKRGYQRLRFELISDDVNSLKDFELTDKFMQQLEKSIREYPDQYFWTHKRWKYKREDSEEN